MADDTVQVTIGADASGLVTGASTAKAEINKIVEAIAILQKSIHATSQAMTTEMVGAINGLKGGLASTTPTIRAAKAEIDGLQKSVQGIGSGGGGHGTILGMQSGVFLELRALLDEALAGRMRNFEGSFARLLGLLGPTISGFAAANPMIAAMGAAAAVAALPLGYLAYEMVALKRASDEFDATKVIDQFHGMGDAATAVVSAIATAADTSYSSAKKFAEPFLELGPGGEKLAELAAHYLPEYTRAGMDAAKAGELLANNFKNLSTTGAEYVNRTVGLSAATKQQYAAAVQAGDSIKAYGIIIQAMQARLDDARESADKMKGSISDLSEEFAAAGTDMDEFSRRAAELESLNRGAEAAKKAAEAIKGLRSEASQEFGKSGVLAAAKAADAEKVVQSVNKESTEVTKLKGEYDQLAEQLDKIDQSANPATSGATAIRAAMAKVVDQMREAQEKANGGLIPTTAFEKAQEQIKQLEATFKGLKSTLLTQELNILGLQKLGNNVPSGTKEGQQFSDEIAAKRKALTEAGTEEYIKSEQIKSAAEGKGSAESLALAQKVEAAKRAAYGRGSQEEQAAQLQVAQAAHAVADEKNADELAKLDEQIIALKKATQDKLSEYADDVKNHRVSAQAGAQEAIAALHQEEVAVRHLYELKKALSDNKEGRAVGKQETTDTSDIGNKIKEEQRKAADAAQKPWEDSFKAINSAFDSQISGLLRGTTSWASAFKNVLAGLTTDIIKFFVNWGLQALENQVKQMAINAGMLASTTATVAGQTAAQGAGLAAQKAMNATAVMSDAGKAAAGAYSAVAGVPIIGPILAPAAAAIAFGATEAFASYDVGSWSLPGNTLAQVHAGEMIVPASATPWAQSLMANAAANQGAAGAGGDVHAHFHVNAIDGSSVKSFFANNSKHILGALNGAVKNGDHLGFKALGAR